MQIIDTIKSFLVTRSYSELPERIQTGLDKYTKDDEQILITLLNNRAIYKAPKWADSNSFFNSWFILTDRRIIIAWNSSSFKRFREIPLTEITQVFYELEQDEPRISITCPGKEDIIEFSKGAAPFCEGLERKLDSSMKTAKDQHRHIIDDSSVICNKCSSKIPGESKYCPECGARLGSF